MTESRPPQYPLARQGAGPAPARRPGSVRRTTSIETRWPDGFVAPAEMVGRGRDLLTPKDGGAPATLRTGGFLLTASPLREILALETQPAHPRAGELVGVRAGSASREALADALGDARGSPLYQLLDDFAGASLVAGWIWSHWDPQWVLQMRERARAADFKGPKVDICTGFAEGSSAVEALQRPLESASPERIEVTPLENPGDPLGWHEMLAPDGPISRRARRIDVWREGGLIRVDAAFQDSGATPDGARVAIHEYRVRATVDAATEVVGELDAEPLILPFPECPGAVRNMGRLVGAPIGEFRQRVIEALPGAHGCTHLNDVLRALADVPALAQALPELSPA